MRSDALCLRLWTSGGFGAEPAWGPVCRGPMLALVRRRLALVPRHLGARLACTPWVLHAGPGAAAACRPRSRVGCGQRAPSSRAGAACAVRPDGGAYLWHEPGLRPAMRTFARRHSPGSRGGSGALFSRLVACASRSAEGARSLAAGPGGSGDDRHWRVTQSSRAPRRRSGPFVQLASYAERHCSSVKCRPRQTGEFHLARAALSRVAWPSGNRGRV